MEFQILKTNLSEIEALRNLFLSECTFQFVYNKCHGAGWADVYVFNFHETQVGYGSVWGKDKREERDTIFEFYLKEPFRKYARQIFTKFINVSGVKFIEAQTNDPLLAQMLFEHSVEIQAIAILFEDFLQSELFIPGTRFFKSVSLDDGPEYQLEHNGEIVASGGYVWNYNFPFIDIYYEVKEIYRRKGFGSLITLELKKQAYKLNRIPSARCNVNNIASQRTLMKAGMQVCGYILVGIIQIVNE